MIFTRAKRPHLILVSVVLALAGLLTTAALEAYEEVPNRIVPWAHRPS